MRPTDIPFVRAVFDSGPDDPVFDALLLSGPLVVLLIVAVGRSIVTTAIAAVYLVAIVASILYNAAS